MESHVFDQVIKVDPKQEAGEEESLSKENINFKVGEIENILRSNVWLNTYVNVSFKGTVLSEKKITNITTNISEVVPGSCFLAIVDNTEEEKCKQTLHDAHKQGASIIISPNVYIFDNAFDDIHTIHVSSKETMKHPIRAAARAIIEVLREQFHGPVIFITGASGKTTTKDLTVSALQESGNVLATVANHNGNRALLRRLVELGKNHDVIVIESGAITKQDVRLKANIAKPTISYTTSIGASHLDTMGSIDGVLDTETQQYRIMLESGAPISVIINQDDIRLRNYFEKLKKDFHGKCESFTLSIDDDSADIFAQNKRMYFTNSEMRTSFTAITPWGTQKVDIPLVGDYNVRNALAAVSLAMLSGLTTLESIAKQLYAPSLTANRADFFQSHYGFWVINESYNANPMSMNATFEMMKKVQTEVAQVKKIFAVVSDMDNLAEESEFYHTEAGKYAQQCGFSNLIVGGNFRNAWKSGFGNGVEEFDTFEKCLELMQSLAGDNPQDCFFLIKADWEARLDGLMPLLK